MKSILRFLGASLSILNDNIDETVEQFLNWFIELLNDRSAVHSTLQ